jgi:CelD/BcsL family acetyltransferase involved in cellulose biosynthesis
VDGLPGTLGRPGFAAFLREFCLDLPQGAGCRLYVLKHQNQAVATLLTFSFGSSTLYYQAGWDPDSALASLSPAVVLMAQSIRDAIEQRSTYYEFLRGDEAYKSRWTKTYRTTSTLLIARSFMARNQQRVAWLKDRVKRLMPVKEATEDSPPKQALNSREVNSTALLHDR